MKYQVEFARAVVHVEADSEASAKDAAIAALKLNNPEAYARLTAEHILAINGDDAERWKQHSV